MPNVTDQSKYYQSEQGIPVPASRVSASTQEITRPHTPGEDTSFHALALVAGDKHCLSLLQNRHLNPIQPFRLFVSSSPPPPSKGPKLAAGRARR